MVVMLNRSLIMAENNSYIGSKTAIYGIEATLPKASLYRSITCVLSLNYRIKEYEQKIAEVQKRIQLV